jgi:uncharacterized peroxidase-related enzyme
MPKANKSAKTAAKTAIAKPNKDQLVLRAIKGGKAAPTKMPAAKAAATKAILTKPGSAVADDVPVIGLNLEAAKLSPAMAAYFKKCQDKLGFVPNVLFAYAFDMVKLEPFVAMYNELMLGDSGLSKLEREMIAVAVSSQNRCYYCLTAHGAAVRQYSGNPLLGEHLVMNYRVARLNKRQRAMLDFAVKLTASPWSVEEGDRERLRRVGFTDREIWDISAVASFFNMSNRVASATDMRPNTAYHGQAR